MSGEGENLRTNKLERHTRPLRRDLYSFVVPVVADKWWDLGIQLLPVASDEQRIATLKIIAADYPHDHVKCCQTMLEKWLQIQEDASWDQLIKALERPGIRLIHLASQLNKWLEEGKGDFTSVIPSIPDSSLYEQCNPEFAEYLPITEELLSDKAVGSKLKLLLHIVKDRYDSYLGHLEVLIEHLTDLTNKAKRLCEEVYEVRRQSKTKAYTGMSAFLTGGAVASIGGPVTIGLGIAALTVGAGCLVGAMFNTATGNSLQHEITSIVEGMKSEFTKVQSAYGELQNQLEQLSIAVVGILPIMNLMCFNTVEQRVVLGFALARHLVYNQTLDLSRTLEVMPRPDFEGQSRNGNGSRSYLNPVIMSVVHEAIAMNVVGRQAIAMKVVGNFFSDIKRQQAKYAEVKNHLFILEEVCTDLKKHYASFKVD